MHIPSEKIYKYHSIVENVNYTIYINIKQANKLCDIKKKITENHMKIGVNRIICETKTI